MSDRQWLSWLSGIEIYVSTVWLSIPLHSTRLYLAGPGGHFQSMLAVQIQTVLIIFYVKIECENNIYISFLTYYRQIPYFLLRKLQINAY